MKVLWFAVSPSLYSCNGKNQGLGWIASLESIVRKDYEIQLAVAFEHNDDVFKVEQDGVIYYPMHVFKDRNDIERRKYYVDIEEALFIPRCKQVIKDFQPDVIHVFGSEWCFGLVQEHTDIPVIIHMQGSHPPYQNALFPPGYSWEEEYKRIPWWNIRWKHRYKLWRQRAKNAVVREERIIRGCKYFMGRTDWDFALTKFYAPESLYFKCWEALRPMFVDNCQQWKVDSARTKYILLSTGPSRLKGMDVILKTARLLKDNAELDLEWRIIGANRDNLYEHENKWSINADDVNVKVLGTLDGDGVYKQLMRCDLYVLPTYIDNSPNSICEAMCLGVPVVSTMTGGVPSLIDNHITGDLVPTNDPYILAYTIRELLFNPELRKQYGENARKVALERHNPDAILNTLKDIYNSVVK